MKNFLLSCLAATTLACNVKNDKCTVGDVDFETIGYIHYRTPAYLDIETVNGEEVMLISEFNGSPWRWGSVAVATGIEDAVQSGSVDITATKLSPSPYKFENPNNSNIVPSSVFSSGETVFCVPDGFSIPGHRDGGVYLLVMDSSDITVVSKAIRITQFIDNTKYQTGHWIDMNNDGLEDLLIARSTNEEGTGELMWLEQPASGALDGDEWTEHKITDGPDVYTTYDVLAEYPDEIVVWAAYDNEIAAIRVSTLDGSFVEKRVIDNNSIKLGGSKVTAAYSLTMVDLNGDGDRQLLFNNWIADTSLNGYWIYKVPADVMNGTYEKIPLKTGFSMAWKYLFTAIAGPGYPFLFYPDGDTNSRAHILLCGHGNEKLWLATPTGNAADFEYQIDEVLDAGAVLPGLKLADLDNDGYPEIYMANYQKGYIQVIKTSPASNYPL